VPLEPPESTLSGLLHPLAAVMGRSMVVRAHGPEPSTIHRDRLSAGILRIDGPKFPVVENQVRLQPPQRYKGETPERGHRMAT
jgi:hypothetical protein